IMGTTASAAKKKVSASPLESGPPGEKKMEDQRSLSIHSFQKKKLHNSKAKSIITNKKKNVVITYNCRKKIQIHDDLLKANYTEKKISEATLEHYLVQGKYFMVRDVYGKLDVLNTTKKSGAPNFRQAKGGYKKKGMGQPSLNGFKLVKKKLQREGHKECVFFCVREEPEKKLRLEGDFVSYTPRKKKNLHENLQRGLRAEKKKLAIRKEIHDFAQLRKKIYYVYDDIERLRDEKKAVRVQCEEDIQVTKKNYRRPIFLLPSYRYHRKKKPAEGAPLEEQFDAKKSFLRKKNSLLLRDPGRPPPAKKIGCQTGVGRTNLAKKKGTLVLHHHHRGAPKKNEAGFISFSSHQKKPHLPKTSPKDRLRKKKTFIEMVPKGQQIVDGAIAKKTEMHDMKEAIYEYKKKLEGIGEDYQIQGSSTKEYFQKKTLQSLERYFYLIAKKNYLHEQYPLGFALSFRKKMCRHPELYRLQAEKKKSELTVTGDLITKGTRVLEKKERFCPDVLSTAKEKKKANFRRVPKMPIYGKKKPSSKTLGSVLRHLTDKKKKHDRILWINLREEKKMEGNEQIYTLREPEKKEELIPERVKKKGFLCPLQKLEAALKKNLLKCQKWLEVYLEKKKQMKMFKSCLTTQKKNSQQKNACQGLTYRKKTIPDFCAPKEQDFDRKKKAMKSALAEDSRAAKKINCSSGRGRTTTAKKKAVLTLWHFNVRIGKKKLSLGPLLLLPVKKMVMKVVQLLPDGHRMKKEVDMALDTVSETMTPMHYHLREIIICT
ncbi:PALD protein, partial [Chunga burmeisteri]|nr:PALD protein [Chunga burmeisteri]